MDRKNDNKLYWQKCEFMGFEHIGISKNNKPIYKLAFKPLGFYSSFKCPLVGLWCSEKELPEKDIQYNVAVDGDFIKFGLPKPKETL